MALPDIKDAGILAEVKLYGWPYHGICSGGNITLPADVAFSTSSTNSDITLVPSTH